MNNPYIIKYRDSRLVNAYHIDEFIRDMRRQSYIYSHNGTVRTRLSDTVKFWAGVAPILMNDYNYGECMTIISGWWYYYNELTGRYTRCAGTPLEYTVFKMILSDYIQPVQK